MTAARTPADFLASGDIAGLFDWRRTLHGSLRMEGEGSASGGEGGGAGSAAPPASGSGGWKAPTSQAELDAIINQAVARTHAKYSDYEDAKTKASKWDEEQSKNQSEVERLAAERDNAKQAETAANEKATKIAREAAIVVEAAKAGAKNPQHVVALLPADSVTVDKDGNIAGADAAVKKFAEDNPDYFGTTTRRTGPPAHGLGPRETAPSTPGAAGKAEAERRYGKKQ